jgi:hypothetical protein
MTRGSGIYDNEEGSAEAPATGGAEKDGDKDTPDVDKNTEEPTA